MSAAQIAPHTLTLFIKTLCGISKHLGSQVVSNGCECWLASLDVEVKTFPLAFFLFLEEIQQNSACEAVRQLLSSTFPQSKNPKYQELVLSHRK